MLALSIRQPYAELILRGIKTVELRSKHTRILGERFYIYASKAKAKPPMWSNDLRAGTPPQWMVELAEQVGMIPPGELARLPTGVIVGTAVIGKCEALRHEGTEARSEMQCGPAASDPQCLRASVPSCLYRWHLIDVQRAKTLRKPKRHPQPAWFRPF